MQSSKYLIDSKIHNFSKKIWLIDRSPQEKL
jgi:hypothetical protein